MSKDSSLGIKTDNSRVLMSDALSGILDEADTLPPEMVESFVTVVISVQFSRDKEPTHIVGTLVGVRKLNSLPGVLLQTAPVKQSNDSNIDTILSVKLMYDDALRLISESVSNVYSFEFHLGVDKTHAFEKSWDLIAAEMFELNPAVNMCTVALELKAK